MKTLIIPGIIVLLLGCHTPAPSEPEAESSTDVTAAYFNLSKDVHTEVLGTQVKSQREMRVELLAAADADGDGRLNEAEKAALRAELKTLKDKMKADLTAKIDQDADGSISDAEKKASLDSMGQKIKEAIKTTHEELRTAQQAARARIKEACSNVRGQGSDEELSAELDACQSVATDEKEKLHNMLKESLAELKAEIEELKGLLAKVETQNATI